MMKQQRIWYASEERAKSRVKFVVFDDVGRLTFENSRLVFAGKKHQFEISMNARPKLTRQSWNWVTYLLVGGLLALILLTFALPPGRSNEALLFLIATLVLGVGLGKSTKWVVVEGIDKSGQVGRYYFADGASMGWGGIFGGTHRLLRLMSEGISERAF
jgi:hypothetical protein